MKNVKCKTADKHVFTFYFLINKMSNEEIKQRLIEKFGDQVTNFEEPYGMLTFEAPKDMNLKVLQFLFNDPELSFQFLTDLTAVHYPAFNGKELAVVYHLHNLVA